MRAIKDRDTGGEIIVRHLLHRMGYRYRLHRSDLPGKPDVVFPRWRKAIFVHGCFWHGHGCARGARTPKSNRDYWTGKISRNAARDARNRERLQDMGWSVLTLWECELKDEVGLASRLRSFLMQEAA